MIETFFLPEPPTRSDGLIDLARSELLPGITLCLDFGVTEYADQHMDVVRHDDKVAHVVPIAVEVQQTVGNDL